MIGKALCPKKSVNAYAPTSRIPLTTPLSPHKPLNIRGRSSVYSSSWHATLRWTGSLYVAHRPSNWLSYPSSGPGRGSRILHFLHATTSTLSLISSFHLIYGTRIGELPRMHTNLISGHCNLAHLFHHPHTHPIPVPHIAQFPFTLSPQCLTSHVPLYDRSCSSRRLRRDERTNARIRLLCLASFPYRPSPTYEYAHGLCSFEVAASNPVPELTVFLSPVCHLCND